MSDFNRRFERLKAQLAQPDSRVHAALLYGRDARRLEELARSISQGWACTSEETRPCGQCPSCHMTVAGESLDELEVRPMGRSHLIRLASIRRVPNARAEDSETVPLKEFAAHRPVFASHRVVRIIEADRMTEEASNALLKTLEEPSPSVRFVLTTQHMALLRTTIVSRCLAVCCPSEDVVPDDSAAALLRDLRPENALHFAERFRQGVGADSEELDAGQRLLNTRALESLANWFSHFCQGGEKARRAIAEAHRRTQANGSFAVITDSLFLTLATDRNHWNLRQ